MPYYNVLMAVGACKRTAASLRQFTTIYIIAAANLINRQIKPVNSWHANIINIIVVPA